MQTKKCSKCGEVKDFKEFSRRNKTAGSCGSVCLKCTAIYANEFRKTKEGVVSVIYSSQRTHSKRRGHLMPVYTRNELKEWLFNQELFHELYNDWVDSGYKRNLKPSVDRVFDDRGYSINNIQLTIAITNARKQSTLKRIGFKNEELKPVVAVSLGDGHITHFISIRSASRETGVSRNGISSCCHKRRTKDGKGFYYTPSSAGGYAWIFKELFNKDTFSFDNPYHIKQLRAVISIDINGNKTEYPSTAEAAIVTGIPRTTITSCLNRRIKDGRNRSFQWNYKKEYELENN